MNYAIIHIADIHFRNDAAEGASSIIKALMNDLEIQITNMPEYEFYFAIVGDIVKKGENVQAFNAFISGVDGKLNAIGLTKNRRIIVPGNHDVNRNLIEANYDTCKQAFEEYSGNEEIFNDFISKANPFNSHFNNYDNFIKQFANVEGNYKTSGWGMNINNDIGIYCLNTALLSFGGFDKIKDNGRLAINTRDLVQWCEENKSPIKILLHHHPFEHLNSWSQTELQHIVEDNFNVCLSGHDHVQDVYYNVAPNKTLFNTAPPLFTGKETLLGYSIILIENNIPSAILYREYSRGSFFPSATLSKNKTGKVDLGDKKLHNIYEMKSKLEHALRSFKDQPSIFIEPKLSTQREFNDDKNYLHELIESPYDCLIIAPPQFGRTCLGLYMRLEAYKKHQHWVYIDAKYIKSRKILEAIEEEIFHYHDNISKLKCIVLDSWDINDIDHMNMVKHINDKHRDISLVILVEDTLLLDITGNLSKLERKFKHLHLQALSRNSMRQLVAGFNSSKHIGNEDIVLSGIAMHMESINVHRTPLNCYTLLRVLDSGYNESLLNKTKLLKAILFVLFTDSSSFMFSSQKPEVEECAFVMGCFCKELIKQSTRSFEASTFSKKLKDICEAKSIVINIDAMIDILIDNNILVRNGADIEFRHRYWIFYFAAEWMHHDDDFRKYILTEKNYINYPEIIEFYSGIDGRRSDVLEVLLTDLANLVDQVDKNIGIDSTFDPLSTLLWNPTDEYIKATKSQIADKVESSNLPSEIKDKHADSNYQSAAPYDQSIGRFMTDYSVLSLIHAIKAASRALRSSPFVESDLKNRTAAAIVGGWAEISRVIFWLSPYLAKEGRASRDGFSLMLGEGFSDNIDQRFKEIIISNLGNVIDLLRGDLASKKIGPLLYECFNKVESKPQKHLIALFIATVRPIGWYDKTLEYINLLHPRSYYLGDMLSRLESEVTLGDMEQGEESSLKQLTGAIIAKREYAPKIFSDKQIPLNKIMSDENKLPLDKLLKGNKRRWIS